MTYYHDLITKKSWQTLQKLKKDLKFTLIGGWAVWLYAKTLKSKDIDIIINFSQLEKLRHKYDFSKNSRLKKYEVKYEEIDIDIYLPYYSSIGIPVEEISKQSVLVNGFYLPPKELLVLLKQKAYNSRKLSIKGRKDMLDIFSLIILPDFNWKLYKGFLDKYKLSGFFVGMRGLIKKSNDVKELGLNKHKFARLKKELLANLVI